MATGGVLCGGRYSHPPLRFSAGRILMNALDAFVLKAVAWKLPIQPLPQFRFQGRMHYRWSLINPTLTVARSPADTETGMPRWILAARNAAFCHAPFRTFSQANIVYRPGGRVLNTK